MITITGVDHLVLTVRDIAQTCEFYRNVLGMQVIRFGENRTALRFGDSKINLHQVGNELAPAAEKPTPGSADSHPQPAFTTSLGTTSSRQGAGLSRLID